MQSPLFLLPGTMCDGRLWQQMLPYLGELPIFHGDYTGSTSLDAMVGKVMDQLPESPCHVVGFSLGGYIAALACLRAPERFKSLTLIATSPRGLSEEEKVFRRQNAQTLARVPYSGMSTARLRQFVDESHWGNEAITGTIRQMERDLGKDELIRQLLVPIERGDISADLAALEIPVHFIMADDDRMVSSSPAEELANAHSHITLHRVKGSGHMVPLEVPEALTAILQPIVSNSSVSRTRA